MTYHIMVTQTRHGYLEIEADNEENALELAEKWCNHEQMLPDMEDTERVLFELI